MSKALHLLAACCALAVTAPVKANLVTEPTFEQKMAWAELVVIGTVTASGPARVTVSVLRTLKGQSSDTITVSTYERIAELHYLCCDVGATYLMFLHGRMNGEPPGSVFGGYGMVRIGGPPNQVQVIRQQ